MSKSIKTQLDKQSSKVDKALKKMTEEARQRRNAKAQERRWRREVALHTIPGEINAG